MIPEQTLVQFPEFSDTGTKVKPGDAKYSAGFQEADVLPAEWLNWFLNKASDGISVINEGISSIEKELDNIVTETGDTPDRDTNNQVVSSIKKLRDAITGTLSNLTTTSKTTLVSAINELVTNIGTLSSLTTTVKTSLVGAVNEVDGDIGNLTSLTTTNKTNIVAACNEIVTNCGALTSLTTTVKTSLVAAVNELNSNKSAVTLNGTAESTPSFYAPTEAGTSNQILMSNGSGAPTWVNPTFFSGVCSTAATTAAKEVTLTTRAFRLIDGVSVRILFTYASTVNNGHTLNINGTGAKSIKVYKSESLIDIPRKSAKWKGSSSATYKIWDAGTVIDFIYSQTNDCWVVSGNPVLLSYSTTGTSHNSYRVYADGYKEQWGKAAHNSEATISYDISFTNTPCVIANPDYAVSGYSVNSATLGLFAHNVGTASFAITTSLTSSYANQVAFWKACGY